MQYTNTINLYFKKLLLSGSIFLFGINILFAEGTIVDYNIISGSKPIAPLIDTSSKLKFSIDKEGIQDKFSDLDYQEEKSGKFITSITFSKNKQKLHEFNDTDINGKFDVWKVYQNDKIVFQMQIDEEKNLIKEKIIYSDDGDILEVYLDKNQKGFFDEKNIYNKGSITRTYKDNDGDGLFESETSYLSDKAIVEEINESIKVEHFNIQNLYIGGFYRIEEYPILDKEFTKLVFNELADKIKNKYQDVEKYYSILQKKTSTKKLEKKYFNRFNLFSTVFKNKNKKNKSKNYLLIGDIIKTKNRIRVYYRIIGPTPLDNVINKSIQKAMASLKVKEITTEIKNDLDTSIIFAGDKNYHP